MTILKVQSLKKDESGIALIFSLIVLSLLLILALSFALDSMFMQKAAYNSANSSSSGLLAQAQLRQIFALIKNNQDVYSDSKMYSLDSNSPARTDSDMLQDGLVVSGVLESNDPLLTGTPTVKWSYIRSGPNPSDSIVGRTAFVVILDDKMPLDSLLDQRKTSTTLGNANYTIYPKHDEEYPSETRIGKYVSEINIRDVIPTAVNNFGGTSNVKVNAMMAAMNLQATGSDLGFTAGEYTGDWSSFDSLFSTLETAVVNVIAPTSFKISEDPADEEGSDFKDKLSLTVSKDPEEFWADLNGDAIIDSNELYKRFDLTRNWDTATHADDLSFIKNQILLNATLGDDPDTPMEPWDNTDSDANSAGLPWLVCFGYKEDPLNLGTAIADESLKGNFDFVRDRRYQIAANLKDYCDTDNRPTSDVDPATWTSSEPTFTGNERTPYINEIGFKVTGSQGQVKIGRYNVWANLGITPTVELINIYGPNWSEELTLEIQGTVSIETKVHQQKPNDEFLIVTVDHPINCSIPIPTSAWASNTGYSNFISATEILFTNVNLQKKIIPGNLGIEIKVIGFSITKAVLHNGTVAYDYTQTLTNASPALASSPYPFEIFIGDNTSIEKSAWFGLAVHDPRQNLNADDWVQMTPVAATDFTTTTPVSVFSVSGTSPYAGEPNAENSTYGGGTNTEAPSVGDGFALDKEGIVTDPANCSISTAFIRNGPMESPWELGFIHRAARWQTINLKVYDTTKAFQVISLGTSPDERYYIPGGGLYSAGDANILDQIKMMPEAESPQKIDLKSPRIDATTNRSPTFDALFSRIRLKSVITRDTNFPVVAANHMNIESMAGRNPLKTELTSVASGEIEVLGNAIMTKFNTASADEIRTRASVVDQLVVNVGTAADAENEELIGKIINLTKVNDRDSASGFTVIILAQTIKDIGGDGTDINIYKYSANGYLKDSPCRIGQFDVYIDSINVDYKNNVYFDEITAEQKIQVDCVRNSDGTITIKKFQYID